MMKALEDIREMLCEELDEIAKKGELTAGSLETVHKITDTVKNIDKIYMLEEQGNSGDDWYARGSYRRGRFMADGYGDTSGMMSGRGRSYRSYSRAEGKDMLRDRMEEMMDRVSGDERQILQHAMQIMGK